MVIPPSINTNVFSFSYAKGDLDISYITSRIAGMISISFLNLISPWS